MPTNDLDLTERALRSRPLTHCPACTSAALEPVTDGETVNFACSECGRCWRVELGWVQRVDPSRCRGCTTPLRCAGRYARDHPELDAHAV